MSPHRSLRGRRVGSGNCGQRPKRIDWIQLTEKARRYDRQEEVESMRAAEEMLYKCRDDALLRQMAEEMLVSRKMVIEVSVSGCQQTLVLNGQHWDGYWCQISVRVSFVG